MKKFYEETLSVEEIYKGKIIQLDVEKVRLPNGNESSREIVRHPGAVGILPLTADGRIILVEQFRKPLDRSILEIPAGKLEKGEDPRHCAIRELKEETGYVSLQIEQLLSFYTAPGFTDEIMHLFIATNCQAGEQEPDEDEFVELKLLTMEEAYQAIAKQQIIDAKTIMSIYYWDLMSQKG